MMRRAILYTVCLWAVWLLSGCGGNGEQMRSCLEQLEQQNVSDEPMLNDSLAEALVDYFDRHGSPNEKMRAKYILGRTYYDLGELPRALETYNEAADCADTTATDCDFAKLSRVHAQSAEVFRRQVQARSQLAHLRQAEYYAMRGQDTLMQIECLARQANAYDMLHNNDSVILIKEQAASKYMAIGRKDRAAQTLSLAISALIEKGDIAKATEYVNLYESHSGNFDPDGKIQKGREVYYYIKGEYYLAIGQLDSAEYMFRTELRDGKDLNNQIAGSKGLQEVFERKKSVDSIAKYATLGYNLNDSAYSLSEMQNVQQFQASYNYNHKKELAEQAHRKELLAYFWVATVVFLLVIAIMACLYYVVSKRHAENEFIQKAYELEKVQSDLLVLRQKDSDTADLIAKKDREMKHLQTELTRLKKQSERDAANLELRLNNDENVRFLRELLKRNPVEPALPDDIKKLFVLINKEIPVFYTTLNTTDYTLRSIEYEVCVLLRCHFKPAEICKLTGRTDSYIANLRRTLLKKCFGIEGSPGEFDKRILSIK